MKWNLYTHPLYNPTLKIGATVGTLVTVFLSENKQYIKRVFDVNGTTVSRKKPTLKSVSSMQKLFTNEMHWLHILKNSNNIPKLIDYNETEMSITQEFAGTDVYTLLGHKKRLPEDIDIQLFEMYQEYKENGLFKGNGDPRNLAIKNGKLTAFDFKWAKPRYKEGVVKEWMSICHFMKRIHPNTLYRLRQTFADFPEEQALLKI